MVKCECSVDRWRPRDPYPSPSNGCLCGEVRNHLVLGLHWPNMTRLNRMVFHSCRRQRGRRSISRSNNHIKHVADRSLSWQNIQLRANCSNDIQHNALITEEANYARATCNISSILNWQLYSGLLCEGHEKGKIYGQKILVWDLSDN